MHTTAVSTTASEQPPRTFSFPIVGIGASSGGLEAVNKLLEHLPATSGMAYVVVQHLDPHHESILPSLLTRTAKMPACAVEDQMAVEANRIYVIPPNTDMTITAGVFTLAPRTEIDGLHLSIDTFFSSLALDRKHQAIGVLLSGNGSDGTLGLQEIKAEGGMTFAQEESTAAFAHMPHHAIAAGCVDRVLAPEGIAKELTRLSLQPYISHTTSPELLALPPTDEQAFTKILLLLKSATKVDFLAYKPSTLQRRIFRRMIVLQIEQLTDYATYLQNHADEVEILYQEVLIHVTSFFRDPASFGTVMRYVFPELLKSRLSDEPIRIWVSGCSSGEEVYSLAICLLEFLEKRSLTLPIQMFATDINAAALEKARAGIYLAHTLHGISPQRLERFFVPLGGAREGYQVRKSLRECCVFAVHNVAKDPPFSRLDLVSCRNVLIYLGPQLQKKVMQTFHYALNPRGFLLLGTSETASSYSGLFASVERSSKLYVKKNIGAKPPLNFLWNNEKGMEKTGDGERNNSPESALGKLDVQQEADRLLLMNYVPASVVIDADMEILHIRGHTGPYLEPAPGRASFNLLKMAREGLGFGLRGAFDAARKSKSPASRDGLQVNGFGGLREVRVTVVPLKRLPSEPCFLVLFADVAPSPTLDTGAVPSTKQAGRTGKRAVALEQEVTATRAEMQSILEEREVANEQLQAAIEEISSNNEELQSTNEELETSKEELQSINEELITSNQQLQSSNEQLKVAQEYAEAIVETVRDPLLVLNKDLRVEQANTSFYQFFQVVPPQTEGHFLSKLSHGQWNIPQLRALLEHALTTNQPFSNFEVEQRFPAIGHKILLLNGRRILSGREGSENLLLLAMEDITERREVERHKDALLSVTSHELKTPLTSAKLTVQMLQHRCKKAGNQQLFTDLGDINAQLNKLTRLIDGLLDATALETGRLVMHPAQFAVDDLARNIVEEVGRTTPNRRLLIEEEVRAEGYGDRERSGQALINLLSNAIKYSPQTEPIRVRVTADEDEVTLSVQDRGIGIAKKEQRSIFERFARIDDLQRKDIPGLGLGLYIVAEIAKQQHGRVWVQSAPGKGATFFFSLPRREPPA